MLTQLQSLPLLAMIYEVDCKILWFHLSKYPPNGQAMEVDDETAMFESMSAIHRDLFDEIMEEHDDLPRSVVIQAVQKDLSPGRLL